jgi:hypothetical protein
MTDDDSVQTLSARSRQAPKAKAAFIWGKFPKFVLGFIAVSAIVTAGWRPLVVAVIGLVVVPTVSLGLVLLTSRVFGWGVH